MVKVCSIHATRITSKGLPNRHLVFGMHRCEGRCWTVLTLTWIASCFVMPCFAVEWKSEVLVDGLVRETVATNSNRLGIDPQGFIHLVYLDREADQDRLVHLHNMRNRSPGATSNEPIPPDRTANRSASERAALGVKATHWQRDTIAIMRHAPAANSGIQSVALAMAPDGRPHVYWFSANYVGKDYAFEERWAWRGTATGRWQIRTVRQQVNQGGGASLDAIHLAINSRQRFHLTAYVHDAYGAVHRARHRTVVKREYPIVPLPVPPGKTDSGQSNLALDPQDRVHVAYASTLALRDGNAEPGYPDACLTYATWEKGVWSEPEVIVPRVSHSGKSTESSIMSIGILMDDQQEVHIVYIAGRAISGEVLNVEYVRGRPGQWQRWTVQQIDTRDDPAPSAYVTKLEKSPDGRLHFGIGYREMTSYLSGNDATWQQEQRVGRLQGMCLHADGRAVLLTHTENQLLLHQLSP